MIYVIWPLLIHAIYSGGGLCALPVVFDRLIYMSVCSFNMQVFLLAMICVLWVHVHCAILETDLV